MYPGRPPVAVHETHASWVFVAGARAYKIKKPVALAFLDYGTLERRHAACREEVRVNRELAPGVYIGVRAIVKTPSGFRLAPEGSAGVVEYAVEMRRFDEADTVDGLIAAGALNAEHINTVARRLAEFHHLAPTVAGGGVRATLHMWRTNAQEFAAASDAVGWHVEDAAGRFGEVFVRAHGQEIERRREEGLVRDGHGDLRCEHVLARPEVRVVDRVEFDPALRHVDVACDLAFLAMDLEAHGQRWAADALWAAYRQSGMSCGSEPLRCFYAAHWALVRAKVAVIAAGEHHGAVCDQQLQAAEALWKLSGRLCWRARAPLAVVVCGPAASGKSTLAAELSERSGLPAVSSDVLRKRLAGLTATERAQPEHYNDEFTQATYRGLGCEALQQLERCGGVIVDASCHTRVERGLLLGRLDRVGLMMLVVRCEIPVDVAIRRAERRLQDPERISDATPEIVAAQARAFEPLGELPVDWVLALDTEQPLGAQADEVTRALDRRIRCSSDGVGEPRSSSCPPTPPTIEISRRAR